MVFVGASNPYRGLEDRGYINFQDADLLVHSQTVPAKSEVHVEDKGFTVELKGNAWYYIELKKPYLVTEQTVIEFEFWSDNQPTKGTLGAGGDLTEPDICAIGLSEQKNTGLSGKREFVQVYGKQPWARTRYLSKGTGGDIKSDGSDRYADKSDITSLGKWIKYECSLNSVSDEALGLRRWLYLIADHDTPRDRDPSAHVKFRNVRIYEDPYLVKFSGNLIRFPDQDESGTSLVQVKDNGYSLDFKGDAWRALELPEAYSVTADTYIEFWFRSQTVGQIQGLGVFPSAGALTVSGAGVGGKFADVEPYLTRIYGDGTFDYRNFANESRYPQFAGQWVKYKFYLTGKASLGDVCTHLMLVNSDDERSGSPRKIVADQGQMEISMLRIGEGDYREIPKLNSQFLFRSNAGVTVDFNSKVKAWHSTPGEYLETDALTTQLPEYKDPALHSFPYQRYPGVKGNGNGLRSPLLTDPSRLFHGDSYCYWIVLNLDGVSTGTIASFEGDIPSFSAKGKERVRISIGERGLTYTHAPKTLSPVDTSYDFVNDKNTPVNAPDTLVLITAFRDDAEFFVPSQNQITLRTGYFLFINGQQVKRSFRPLADPTTPASLDRRDFESTEFSLDLLGDQDGDNGFNSELYFVAISNDKNDICNLDAINKELMAHFGIVSTPSTQSTSTFGQSLLRKRMLGIESYIGDYYSNSLVPQDYFDEATAINPLFTKENFGGIGEIEGFTEEEDVFLLHDLVMLAEATSKSFTAASDLNQLLVMFRNVSLPLTARLRHKSKITSYIKFLLPVYELQVSCLKLLPKENSPIAYSLLRDFVRSNCIPTGFLLNYASIYFEVVKKNLPYTETPLSSVDFTVSWKVFPEAMNRLCNKISDNRIKGVYEWGVDTELDTILDKIREMTGDIYGLKIDNFPSEGNSNICYFGSTLGYVVLLASESIDRS